MVLAALFGLVGVAVACLGLYGTIAYSVARRTNEIGVRLALGASPSGVWWMVLRETLSLVLCGVAAGVLVMLPLSRALSSQLFGLTGRDPLTLAIASAVVVSVGALAGADPTGQLAVLARVARRESESDGGAAGGLTTERAQNPKILGPPGLACRLACFNPCRSPSCRLS